MAGLYYGKCTLLLRQWHLVGFELAPGDRTTMLVSIVGFNRVEYNVNYRYVYSKFMRVFG